MYAAGAFSPSTPLKALPCSLAAFTFRRAKEKFPLSVRPLFLLLFLSFLFLASSSSLHAFYHSLPPHSLRLRSEFKGRSLLKTRKAPSLLSPLQKELSRVARSGLLLSPRPPCTPTAGRCFYPPFITYSPPNPLDSLPSSVIARTPSLPLQSPSSAHRAHVPELFLRQQ